MSLAQEIGTVKSLWLRDMLRLSKERSRWIGVVASPLLIWLFIGLGIDASYPNADWSYLSYFFPGIVLMSLLNTTIYASMSIIEDRDMGFLQAVLVAPASRAALLGGKMLGVGSVGLIQSLVFWAIAPWAGFAFSGIQWEWLILITVLGLMSMTAMNFIFAWTLHSTQGYHSVMNVLLIPLWMLSGAIFPGMPAWLDWLTLLNPLSYMLQGLRAALSGTAGTEMWTSAWVILLFGVLMFGLGCFTCRRKGGSFFRDIPV